MNTESKKKRNTVIFVAVATVLNVVLMVFFLICGYILLAKFGKPENVTANQIWVVVIFLGSIVLSWLIYSRMVKWYMKKVNIDEKFAPLIGPKRYKKRPDDSQSNPRNTTQSDSQNNSQSIKG